MRLVAGIIEPTAGRVVVRGSVAPMIQVGGALSPDLTVAENVVLLGSILGADPRAVRREVADIVGWAGLEEYIGEPVRTLSSGMAARLAFAVCTHRRPDVLVMDEILAVGDETFQRRSLQRVAELRDAGTSVLLVSHALDVIADRAQRCLWLDHGELRRAGDPADVVAAYRESRQAREPRA
jgi:ABC-type polysaccharide/polyol phosphate transport system ATPase subunit